MAAPGYIRLFLEDIEPVLQRDLQRRCDRGLRLRKAQRPVVLLCAGVPRDPRHKLRRGVSIRSR